MFSFNESLRFRKENTILSSYDFNLFPTERTVTGRWTRDGSQTCIGLACSRNHLPPSVGISSPNTQGKKIWGQINLCRLEKFTKTNFDLGILKFQFGTIQDLKGGGRALEQNCREFVRFFSAQASGTNTGNRQRRKQGTEALFGAIFGISSGKLSIGHNCWLIIQNNC